MNRELSMEIGKKKQRCYKERNENKSFFRENEKDEEKNAMKMEGKKGVGGSLEEKFESQLRELIFFFFLLLDCWCMKKKRRKKKRKQR